MTREELYERAWSQPMSRTAAELGVSGSYLARICDQLDVPRPPPGYWAKHAVGKAPPPTLLPSAVPGQPDTWEPGRTPVARAHVVAAPATKEPRARLVRVREGETHALLQGARAHFENTRRIDEGEFLKPYKKLLVDITVTRSALEPALRLANELFNTLVAAGHRIVLAPKGLSLARGEVDPKDAPRAKRYNEYRTRWSPDRPTVVFIGTVAIGLAIIETTEEVELRYLGGRYVRESEFRKTYRGRAFDGYGWTTKRDLATGRFKVVAYSPYHRVEWSETWITGPRGSLRGRSGEIVAALEQGARDLVPLIEEAERKAEIERQEWRAALERHDRRRDHREIKKSRADSAAQLNEIMATWSRRMEQERFIEGLERRAEALPPSDRARLLDRLQQAREFLGSTDPLDPFLSWKTPVERYKPRYPPVEDGGEPGA